MIHYITNETRLAEAVKIHQPGDLFKCSDTFIVEGNYEVHGVTFHDMSVILWQRHYGKVEGIKPFLKATDCKFVRTKIFGKMPTTPTTWQQDGLQFGVHAIDCALYDCNVEEVNYIGFMLECSTVFGGSFNSCATPKDGYGFGHPLWVDGDSSISHIINGSFKNNRHCIASSKDKSGVIVTNCEFSCGQYSKHILDRHGEGGKGGYGFMVENCIFNNPNNYAYDFATHVQTPIFRNCTFARPFGKNGRIGGVVEKEGLAVYENCIYLKP